MNIINFREFIYNQHNVVCNQKYNSTLPYSFHLSMVEAQYEKFNYLLEKQERVIAIKGCIAHDVIEDARLTYNDLLNNAASREVADIVILCTEFSRGKSREERKPKEFYKELATNKVAVFVKLCDIIANSLFSLMSNSSIFEKYKKEYETKVKPLLYIEQYKDMFDYLDKIYNL
jgi:hypothetical protein